jgi:hypothetical protein
MLDAGYKDMSCVADDIPLFRIHKLKRLFKTQDFRARQSKTYEDTEIQRFVNPYILAPTRQSRRQPVHVSGAVSTLVDIIAQPALMLRISYEEDTLNGIKANAVRLGSAFTVAVAPCE